MFCQAIKKTMVILLLATHSHWAATLPAALQTTRMQYIMRKAARAARSSLSVLIEGEQGTGKKTLARFIHNNSPRRSKPFIEVDCSTIQSDIRDVLIGKLTDTSKSSRSSAKTPSLLSCSLLLENIHFLPEDDQKSLVLLLNNDITPAKKKMNQHDIRVLATTQTNLFAMVQKDRFNADLFYRLDIMSLSLPPLRERQDDIPIIAEDFLHRFAEHYGKTLETIDPDALEVLQDYSWPGNLEELKTVMSEAVSHTTRNRITAQDIAKAACEFGAFTRPSSTSGTSQLTTLELFDSSGDLRPLIDLEAEIIRFALDHYNSHISEVSRRLGIGRSTLYRKIKEHCLETAIH